FSNLAARRLALRFFASIGIIRHGRPILAREPFLPSQRLLPWLFGAAIAVFVAGAPFVHYRWSYTYGKRLRTVVDGKVYRSGCMTADGFESTIRENRIRTVLNLQEEAPDPDLAASYLGWGSEKESDL